jgi:hypothetical protein
MCVLSVSTPFVQNIFHVKNNLATYYRECTCLNVKRQVFEKKSQVPSIMKILSVGAQLFHTETQLDG